MRHGEDGKRLHCSIYLQHQTISTCNLNQRLGGGPVNEAEKGIVPTFHLAVVNKVGKMG